MSPEEAIAAQRLALQHDYGQFVCGDVPIDINGARAFNPGDAVPASHVERFPELKQLVEKVATPAPKPTKAAVHAAVADDKTGA